MYVKRKDYICNMKERKIEIAYEVFTIDELNVKDQQLIQAARKATGRSYAPYSHFHVGAAALLENGIIVTGTNQENVASPSGLCAERTTLFYANSQYPDQKVITLAIAACHTEKGIPTFPVTPCGACRQVLLETENRYGFPMRILLCGEKEVYVIKSAKDLLPLSFDNY